jgi:hypothetical protein
LGAYTASRPETGLLIPSDYNSLLSSYNPAMWRTIGIALILLGAIGLEICGIVLWHWPLPIPGFIFRRLGTFGFTVDPVKGPIWSVVLLTVGFFLLLQTKLARSK